jgi:hypothetical protein
MKRHFQDLHQADHSAACDVSEGMFLVLVQRAQYRWHAQKPFYLLRFFVLEPQQFESKTFTGRLYCTSKDLWKLTWFLRDFGYDTELLGHDEVDEKNLIGLRGVVKTSHTVLNGITLLNLDAFASASQWKELSTVAPSKLSGSEAAR